MTDVASPSPARRLRVVQWTTGIVGSAALRAIIDDPRLQLVGVFAHSSDKVGRDAGDLADRATTGFAPCRRVMRVTATPEAFVVVCRWMNGSLQRSQYHAGI